MANVVSEIMYTKLNTVDVATPLTKIRDLFQQTRTHHVLITEQDVVVGIMSDRDLLRNISPFIGTKSEKKLDQDTLNREAREMMNKNLITVPPDTTLHDAATLMLQKKISCLPVMANKIMGIVAWCDFVKSYQNKTRLCKEVMSKPPIGVDMDAKIEKILNLLHTRNIHHIPVTETGKIVGMISDRDIIKLSSPFLKTEQEREQDLEIMQKRAHHIMSRKLITVKIQTTFFDAVQLLIKHSISSLPVLDEREMLVGIITWRDLLKQF